MKKTQIINQLVEAVDVHTLERFSADDYRNYLKSEGLFMVNHHDILVSSCAGYPIALSKKHLDIYIEELKNIRHLLP
ncbi:MULTISPECIES: hypothetical protein [Aeromonas]|uniref:hypothetical protein n=1 Tax=Aeromonas TaxID=642 RepID=UPI001C23AEFE|nr:hypothetical protein [Aeromonas sp. FDAARGOS 1407]QXC36090.1 hypothetical protein I6L37_10795 [Aeromonas sp. FDAARGOS 1407]